MLISILEEDSMSGENFWLPRTKYTTYRHLQLFLTSVKLQSNFGHSRSLAGRFGFGLTETEYLPFPLKEAETLAYNFGSSTCNLLYELKD